MLNREHVMYTENLIFVLYIHIIFTATHIYICIYIRYPYGYGKPRNEVCQKDKMYHAAFAIVHYNKIINETESFRVLAKA